MFFKNLSIYRLPSFPVGLEVLEGLLSSKPLNQCGQTDAQSIGWVSPRQGGAFAHVANQQILLALGVERKILPASVVKQFANSRAKEIEEAEGRRVGRKEMREISESMTLELLPRAFVQRRTTFCWIDPVNGWLVVDSPSPTRAEELLEHLHKAIDGLQVKPLRVNRSPSSAMTDWVSGGAVPAGFTVDQDLNLRSAENAEVRYVKHQLEGEEINNQISDGMVATKLAMTWADRISFVLTESMQIKRVSFLDILKEQSDGQAENEDERFDLDFVLMAGELSRMLSILVDSLGGEVAP